MPCFTVRKVLCLCGIVIACVFVGNAQQTDTTSNRTLSEVEVVAKSHLSTTRQGAPLQLMEKAEIERLGLHDLAEAIKRFSGTTVRDYGGIGGLKTVSVRSLGAQHTAVSYDGITISDTQSGQVDISRFSLDNVEAISLSIGQTDDIFQTARMYASAGALSIQTERPEFGDRPYKIRAQIRGGSFGLINPYVRYDQKLGKNWTVSLHGDHLRADGDYTFTLVNGILEEKKKRKNSEIETWRTEVNLSGKLGETGKLSVKGYYFNSERGLPGSIILYNDYSGERLWDKNAFAQIHYENYFNQQFALQAQLKYNYSWNKYQDKSNKYPTGIQEDRYTQNEYYGSVSGLYSPVEKLSFSLVEDFFINTLDNTLPNNPLPERYSSLTVIAGQYQDARLTITTSVLGTYITERVESGDRPNDRKRLSPAVSASWRILPEQNIRIRAAYKDIFRIPTFNDMYYLRIGNTNLVPERTRQYNLGITWNESISAVIPQLSITIDAYYNQVKDKIVAMPTMFIWKMMNFGEVSIKGIDVNIASQISLTDKIDLHIQGAYTYQKAIDMTSETAKNYKHQIPYTPKHTGSVSLSVLNPWVNISYNLTAVGDRYALPQNIDDNRIGRYIEQGIALNREFGIKNCRVRLQGEIINLGNINYDVIQFYPMPGRSLRLSLNIIY